MSRISSVVSLAALVFTVGCQVGGEEYNKFDDEQSDRGFLPGPEVVGEEVIQNLRTPTLADPGSSDAVLVWSEEISNAGASYISPHFASFDLPKDAYLVVRSPDSARAQQYADKGEPIEGVQGFWGIHVNGDTAVVELYANSAVPENAVVIDKYARGLDNFKSKTAADAYAFESKAICGGDDSEWAACAKDTNSTAYDKSKAVARLLINGTSACTGWLVGDEGHLMTNEHCIGTAADAANTNFEFMAEGATCETNCASWFACGDSAHVVTDATLVRLNANLDYAMVKLPGNLSDTYGYFQMRNTGAVNGERIYIPQHPAGWGKKIAFTAGSEWATVTSLTRPACGGSGYQDVGYMADTQGGSSGSPVVSHGDNVVVALHHCANCPNRGVPIQLVIDDLRTAGVLPANALDDGGNGGCRVGDSMVNHDAGGLPVSIPDNSASGVTSTIDIADTGVVSSVALSTNITHTWRGDLQVELTSPSGTKYTAHNRTGSSADNLVLTGVAIDVFNGESANGSWRLKVSDNAGADLGTLDAWSLDLEVRAASDEFSATDVPISIPDNNATGITSEISVSRAGTVNGVALSIQIDHSWRGDLSVDLIAPDGTVHNVHERTGSSADNLTVEELPLDVFNGKNASGTWQLKVQDRAQQDLGTLRSWSLRFLDDGGNGGC